MPWTTTQNTMTGMIILISLMKPSPSGFSLTAVSGHSRPMTTPRTSARTTWPKRERKKRGMATTPDELKLERLDHKLVYNNVVKNSDPAPGTNPWCRACRHGSARRSVKLPAILFEPIAMPANRPTASASLVSARPVALAAPLRAAEITRAERRRGRARAEAGARRVPGRDRTHRAAHLQRRAADRAARRGRRGVGRRDRAGGAARPLRAGRQGRQRAGRRSVASASASRSGRMRRCRRSATPTA